MTTIEVQISDTDNDCTEKNNASLLTQDYLLYPGRTASGSENDAGLRFTNITIPYFADINSAILSVYVNSAQNIADIELTIKGIDIDNSAIWTNTNRPSQLDKTTETVQANYADWNDGTNMAASQFNTIDISTIIQEIVDRKGWTSTNALSVVIENTAADDGTNKYASLEEATYNNPAKLKIEYHDPNWTPPLARIIR